MLAHSVQKALRTGGFLLACILGSTGCYKNTFNNPGVAAGVEHDEWTSFFIFGLVGHEQIDVKKFCPGEVSQVRTGGNVATYLVTSLTFGIYAPRKVYVTCAGGGGTGTAEARDLVVTLDAAGKPVEVAGTLNGRAFVAKPTPVEGKADMFVVAAKTEETR